MSNIQIFIKGEVGSGKSAIAQEIVDTLRQLKFNVKWDVPSEFNDELDARKIDQVDLENRLNAVLSRNTQIIVTEQQIARTPIKKESWITQLRKWWSI